MRKLGIKLFVHNMMLNQPDSANVSFSDALQSLWMASPTKEQSQQNVSAREKATCSQPFAGN